MFKEARRPERNLVLQFVFNILNFMWEENHNMRKIIGIIISICLLIGCCCIAVSAYAQEDVSASLTMEVTEDGAVITGCDKSFTGDMIIPDSYNSTPVVGIAARAFSDCIEIESVVIPNTVTSIGEYAFSECAALKSATLGEGISVISEGAFSYCDALEKVTIDIGVGTVETRAFAYCYALDTIYYMGTEEQFYDIDISSIGNSYFEGAIIYFNAEVNPPTV